MPVDVKICGLSTQETVVAAVEGGAKYVGFVFYPPSPRYVTCEQARQLAETVPTHVSKVALVVNVDDKTLGEIVRTVRPDFLQLHGSEVPERVNGVKERFGLPVIKSAAISTAEDVEAAKAYEHVADMLLFDALPPEGAHLPGGNAIAFDWQLIHGRDWAASWMLAGGLNAGNLEEAVRASGAKTVDVSSGVEVRHGVKSPKKIKEFLETAARL